MLAGKDLTTPEESSGNVESESKLREEYPDCFNCAPCKCDDECGCVPGPCAICGHAKGENRKLGNVFWWTIAFLPLIALLIFLLIGFIGSLLIQSIKTDGHLVLIVGILGPTWFLALWFKLLPLGDQEEDHAWRIALTLSIILWFVFLVPQLLFSIGWL